MVTDIRLAIENARSDASRTTKDRVVALLGQWATTHPDPLVTDELWTFVEKLRAMELR